MIDNETVEQFQNNGAALIRGVFKDWIPLLSKGAEHNFKHPSERALTHRAADEVGTDGIFLEDFCSWQRIPEFTEFVYDSSLGSLAAQLMQSSRVQFFHDHYLHKEAQSGVATPWHQDSPYYFVQGMQTVSFWVPLESRAESISLKCAAGTHLLPKEIRPTSWSTLESFYQDDALFMDMPDMESGEYDVKVWAVEPGDAVAFNFRTIHAANANTVKSVSRTLSFRLFGDDVRYLKRPGRTSPDFPDLVLASGARMPEALFPVVFGN